MNYSFIIDNMTWSFSRINSFLDCPYKFFLTYIENVDEHRNFFSDFGSFVHLIIQKFLTKELSKTELVPFYLANFKENIQGLAPSEKIFTNYLMQGREYFQGLVYPNEEVLAIEKKVSFNIEDKQFVGFVDWVSRDENGLIITDNKSRTLKPRSKRKKPTVTDKELDDYLRQLYLYSIPISTSYETNPTTLRFNCFRNQTTIAEPFDESALDATKSWALESIESIKREEKWQPNIDWFKCKYICGCSHECEYFQMFGGDGE